MADLLLKEEVFNVVGAAIEVHRQLGQGFLEAVYQEAMQIELSLRHIPFAAKPKLPIQYRGRTLASYYEADLICYGSVIVELKALTNLSGAEEAQVINYLKATGLRVGVLINFGEPAPLTWKRFVR